MRGYIIKGFLPWILFLAFADGSVTGVGLGGMLGITCLLSINFPSLKRWFILDWSALIFLLSMVFIVFGFHYYKIAIYDLLASCIILTLVCFVSLPIRIPVTQQYAKLRVAKIYWKNQIFLNTNFWLTFFWGLMFLCAAISAGLQLYGIGSQKWMMQIIPTICVVAGIIFTILFPDTYRDRKVKQSTIGSINTISDVDQIVLGDLTIGYRILGEGPVLVLANDAYMTMHTWDPDFLKRLGMKFKVLIFDYPGIGYSNGDHLAFDTETIAAYLKRMLEKLALKPQAIIGFGMGGYIAQQFVMDKRNKDVSLILINSNLPGKEAKQANEQITQRLIKQAHKKLYNSLSYLFPEEAPDRVIDKLREVSESANLLDGKIPTEIIEKQTSLIDKWHKSTEPAHLTEQLKSPALLITGIKDMIVPAENAELLAKKLQHAKSVSYEDAGHGVIYQYPFDIADHIVEFLQQKRKD